MSNHIAIENLLHKARMEQLANNIPECISLYVQVMNTVDELLKDPNCADQEWLTCCMEHTVEEFNLIRSTYPGIRVMTKDMKDSEETVAHEETVVTESEEKKPSDLHSTIMEIDEKYHISESISNGCKMGYKNVTEYFRDEKYKEDAKKVQESTASFLSRPEVKKVVDTIQSVSYTIIKGILTGVVFVSKSVYEAINKAPIMQDSVAPQPEGTADPSLASVDKKEDGNLGEPHADEEVKPEEGVKPLIV